MVVGYSKEAAVFYESTEEKMRKQAKERAEVRQVRKARLKRLIAVFEHTFKETDPGLYQTVKENLFAVWESYNFHKEIVHAHIQIQGELEHHGSKEALEKWNLAYEGFRKMEHFISGL